MPTKRELLAKLTRDERLTILERFELSADRRSSAAMLEAIASSKKAKLGPVLESYARDRLKEALPPQPGDTPPMPKRLPPEHQTREQIRRRPRHGPHRPTTTTTRPPSLHAPRRPPRLPAPPARPASDRLAPRHREPRASMASAGEEDPTSSGTHILADDLFSSIDEIEDIRADLHTRARTTPPR